MNLFQHYAVVFVFVIACTVVHGLNIGDIDPNEYHWETMDEVQTYDPTTYRIEYIDGNNLYNYWRRKRGFFSSINIPMMPYINSVDDGDKETAVERTVITSDADVTTTVVAEKAASTSENIKAAYRNLMDSIHSSKVTHIVSIGTDVDRTLKEASPYLPLVYKVTTYTVPGLSLHDVVTLSVNVAVLVTNDTANEDLIKPDVGAKIGQYANGIYNKLKDTFKSHFGHITNYLSDEEKTNSLPENQSIFDKVKNKINIFGSFMKSYDAPPIENKETKIETIVTQTYIESDEPPKTNTIITKTYESDAESLHKVTNGETNHVVIDTKLLENGKHRVGKIITEMKNEFISNENSANDSNGSDADDDIEAYDDNNDDENMSDVDGNKNDDDRNMNHDNENMINEDKDKIDDDDDDENTNDNKVEIKEKEFNKVMKESMDLQPDFIKTLDGEELLKQLNELQKSLPNPNTNNRKTFEALIEELDIDEHYSDDQVNELINALEKTTNYFILSKAIDENELLTRKKLLTTQPTPTLN